MSYAIRDGIDLMNNIATISHFRTPIYGISINAIIMAAERSMRPRNLTTTIV